MHSLLYISSSILRLFLTIFILLTIFKSSRNYYCFGSPNRRPIQITPFLYSDAVNIGSEIEENLPSSRRAIFSRNRQFISEDNSINNNLKSISSTNGRIMQISPFFYSSAKRD
ncbi:hypothetical protein Mgra_00005480 [Meloidogyne graminicola]|uniref:Uncharacterized protein n=1 Tax=Meloidogyne graminicola TaxID=189291 RepID=A0A8S9ZNN6_9BILA|nr:hypothetical protein Mgra_00005480 [Meloidogyne graminicola]